MLRTKVGESKAVDSIPGAVTEAEYAFGSEMFPSSLSLRKFELTVDLHHHMATALLLGHLGL